MEPLPGSPCSGFGRGLNGLDLVAEANPWRPCQAGPKVARWSPSQGSVDFVPESVTVYWFLAGTVFFFQGLWCYFSLPMREKKPDENVCVVFFFFLGGGHIVGGIRNSTFAS